MRLNVLAFLLLSAYVSVGAVRAEEQDPGQDGKRSAIGRILHKIGHKITHPFEHPTSTEEEAPQLPSPPPAAPPPPQAATVDPLGAMKEHAKHKLFPLTESDEAYKAYNGDRNENQPKTMDDRSRLILLEGACGDENFVGKCNDQLS